VRELLKPVVEALFRVLFTYDCLGEERVPERGPAVIAANHPSYLDPILLSLQVRRPIRFMAWDALFKVPILGRLVRAFGAFPVDVRRGHGRAAYERARHLVEAGEVVGLFPEGKRSRTGWMEPALREGAARLALETGAPLIPATISGAYRAWPHYQSLPRPARIRVRYHEPIDPEEYRRLPEQEAIDALSSELRRRVDRSLLPGVKRDLRIQVLYRSPAPWPRLYEAVPPLALALVVFWKHRAIAPLLPAYAYVAYLLADHLAIPQSRFAKWLRNASPVLFCLGYAPVVIEALGLPATPAPAALAAVVAGAMFPYLYSRGRTVVAFMRGMVLAVCLELLTLFSFLEPTPIGPHVALPVYAAAFAWQRRTVFHPAAIAVLLGYAAFVSAELGGDVGLLPHVTAGLVAWLLTTVLPDAQRATEPEDGAPGTSLGLSDQ
jgi:1-acyl-sn-glycerol-3-phosphate acyltransferase